MRLAATAKQCFMYDALQTMTMSTTLCVRCWPAAPSPMRSVRQLLAQGARAFTPTTGRHSPLHCVLERANDCYSSMAESMSVAMELLFAGANTLARGKHEQLPIGRAVHYPTLFALLLLNVSEPSDLNHAYSVKPQPQIFDNLQSDDFAQSMHMLHVGDFVDETYDSLVSWCFVGPESAKQLRRDAAGRAKAIKVFGDVAEQWRLFLWSKCVNRVVDLAMIFGNRFDATVLATVCLFDESWLTNVPLYLIVQKIVDVICAKKRCKR